MAKCKNEKFISTIGPQKLNKNVEVDFDVQRNIPDCQKQNAGRYIKTEASAPRYDRYKTPKNQFECMQGLCVNSGTLYNGGSATDYKFKLDAKEFAAGIITFYAYGTTGNAEVTVSADPAFTDADKYSVDLSKVAHADDGYSAVVVDLTQTPTEVGEGWTAEGDYIYVRISMTSAQGLSTISMFESMDDFAVSTHVKARCLTGVDGSFDLDAAEETCFNHGQYDTTDLNAFEKTVSFRAITSNYWRLNPLYRRGKLAKAWDMETVEMTVKALTGTEFGYITLDDIDQSECGFVTVQVLYDCRETKESADALLERLAIPTRVDMDGGHYQLIDNGDGTTTVLFNEMHIGKDVLIAYPKIVDVVDSFDITDEDVNEVRTRMTYVKQYTNGAKYRFVYNNVLITSFPDALSEDVDGEGELTISIQRDASGRFGYAYKILQ